MASQIFYLYVYLSDVLFIFMLFFIHVENKGFLAVDVNVESPLRCWELVLNCLQIEISTSFNKGPLSVQMLNDNDPSLLTCLNTIHRIKMVIVMSAHKQNILAWNIK